MHFDLLDLAHELAIIENITRADLFLAQVSPSRNDYQQGFDKHTYYVAEALGLVKYDHTTGEYI